MPELLRIGLRDGTAEECRTRDALELLLTAHDMSGLVFTSEVEIAEGASPHSHPVLTLNTAFAADAPLLLAEFLHEQLHWFEELHATRRDHAMARTAALYPTVPTDRLEGAGSEDSTRLHLLVCYWEYQALKCLLGVSVARAVIESLSRHHYRWVYRTVLSDEARIGQLIEEEDLLPERLRPFHREAVYGG